MLGPGFHGGLLYSSTTRRAGLVAAPDLTATILDHLGIELPDEVQGNVLERRDGTAADLRETAGRLDVVSGRRDPAVRYFVLSLLLLAAILWLVDKRRGLRAAMRIAFLSALWFPGVALVTAAIRPTRMTETAVLVGGSLLLGAIADRVLRWPLAPALPAAVVLLAHAVDLALGSPLIGQSLVGPNPKGGARFFGIGNELEIALSAIVLLGTGAALAARDGRRAPQWFAAASAAAAVVIGAGRLGADVGGVITLGAGAAVAVLASLPGGPSRRAIALALLVPVAAVGALLVLDLATGGDAHLTEVGERREGTGRPRRHRAAASSHLAERRGEGHAAVQPRGGPDHAGLGRAPPPAPARAALRCRSGGRPGLLRGHRRHASQPPWWAPWPTTPGRSCSWWERPLWHWQSPMCRGVPCRTPRSGTHFQARVLYP